MSEVIIRVENLGKLYHIGENAPYKTLREAITNIFTSSLEKIKNGLESEKQALNYIWALKDVSFQIKRGEVVGIIGRNGSGKTTLLKILSRITTPTEGYVEIQGRASSLLEVGTGFHPELTGRDNIFLSGVILGMKNKEIKCKFDEIVAFAELEKFIDTPVKYYSSGMYVRLAFAVAAHLEPEILLVDEVLAVGDAQFQKKCLGKMGEVAEGGRTVLFVSHNMPAVSTLCPRAILLNSGVLIIDGHSSDVIKNYLELGSNEAGEIIWSDKKEAPGNERVRLRAIRVVSDEKITTNVSIDKPVYVEMEFFNYCSGADISTSIHLLDSIGGMIFAMGTPSEKLPSGLYKATYTFPANFLNDIRYAINACIVTDANNMQLMERQVISFTVHDTAKREDFLGLVMGTLRPKIESSIIRLGD